MSVGKRTYRSRTFQARTFKSATWNGVGVPATVRYVVDRSQEFVAANRGNVLTTANRGTVLTAGRGN